MSAEITKTPVPRTFLAWCDECQDGYKGGMPTATEWKYKHNAERHYVTGW